MANGALLVSAQLLLLCVCAYFVWKLFKRGAKGPALPRGAYAVIKSTEGNVTSLLSRTHRRVCELHDEHGDLFAHEGALDGNTLVFVRAEEQVKTVLFTDRFAPEKIDPTLISGQVRSAIDLVQPMLQGTLFTMQEQGWKRRFRTLSPIFAVHDDRAYFFMTAADEGVAELVAAAKADPAKATAGWSVDISSWCVRVLQLMSLHFAIGPDVSVACAAHPLPAPSPRGRGGGGGGGGCRRRPPTTPAEAAGVSLRPLNLRAPRCCLRYAEELGAFLEPVEYFEKRYSNVSAGGTLEQLKASLKVTERDTDVMLKLLDACRKVVRRARAKRESGEDALHSGKGGPKGALQLMLDDGEYDDEEMAATVANIIIAGAESNAVTAAPSNVASRAAHIPPTRPSPMIQTLATPSPSVSGRRGGDSDGDRAASGHPGQAGSGGPRRLRLQRLGAVHGEAALLRSRRRQGGAPPPPPGHHHPALRGQARGRLHRAR